MTAGRAVCACVSIVQLHNVKIWGLAVLNQRFQSELLFADLSRLFEVFVRHFCNLRGQTVVLSERSTVHNPI